MNGSSFYVAGHGKEHSPRCKGDKIRKQNHVGSVANPELNELEDAMQSHLVACKISSFVVRLSPGEPEVEAGDADPTFHAMMGSSAGVRLERSILLRNSFVPKVQH